MILRFSNVRLRRIELKDIEMLRQWRNDEKIVQYMFFNTYITESMQLKWFESLKMHDYYFVIEYQGKALGLIHLADEDTLEHVAHAGLFIYDESYWGTQVPVLASLRLLEFAFEERMLKTVYAKVQASNKAARRYNKNLGFKEEGKELLSLEVETYKTKLKPLVQRIRKLA